METKLILAFKNNESLVGGRFSSLVPLRKFAGSFLIFSIVFLAVLFPPLIDKAQAAPTTRYLRNTPIGVTGNWEMNTVAGAAADNATIATIGARAGGAVYFHFNPGVANALPVAALPAAIGKGWRSTAAINATIIAGTYTLNYKIVSGGVFVCPAAPCNFVVNYRLWKTDANGVAIGGALTAWTAGLAHNITLANTVFTGSINVITPADIVFGATEYLFVETLVHFSAGTTDDGGEQIIFRVNEALGETLVDPGSTPPDITPPTVGAVTPSAGNATYVPGNFTISATLTDNETAVTSCEYTINGAAWLAGTLSGVAPVWTCTSAAIIQPTGTALTLNIRGTSVGGTGTGTAITRTVDATAPVTTATAGAYTFNTWTTASPVTVTLSASDNVGGSGVAANNPVYCLDTLNTCVPATAYTVPFTVTCLAGTACTQYVRYKSNDNVGNAEVVNSSIVKQDTQSPTTTDNQINSNWQAVEKTVTLTPNDGTGSGVTAATGIYGCFGTLCAPAPLGGATMTTACGVGFECAYDVRYYSVDALANTETTKLSAWQARIDRKGPPQGTFTVASGNATCTIDYAAVIDAGVGNHATATYKLLRKQTTAPASCVDATAATVYSGNLTTQIVEVGPTIVNGNTYIYKLCYYDNLSNETPHTTNQTCTPTATPETRAVDGAAPTSNKGNTGGGTNLAVGTFRLLTSTGVDTITSVTVTRGGTLIDSDVSSVKIYEDTGTVANEWDATDALIGSGTFTAGASTFTPLTLAVSAVARNFVITYDIAVAPSGAGTLTGRVTNITFASANLKTVTDTADGTITVDSTPPTAGAVTPSNTATATHVDSPFDLTTTFTDAGSPVTSCQYTTDGATWLAGVVSGAGPAYTCTKTGITGLNGAALTLNMRGTSTGGTTAATAVSRTVDTAAPATSDNTPAAWQNAEITVTLTPNDGTGSGVTALTGIYGCFGAACVPAPLGGATMTTACGAGFECAYAVRYNSADNVGNIETVKIAVNQARVDRKNPIDGTLAATGGNAAVTLNWTAATDAGSGLNAVNAYKLVFAQSATPPADCTLGTQIYLGNLLTYNHTPVTNGLPYSYRVCAYDNAGNVSAGPTATATPSADSTPPAAGAVTPSNTATATHVDSPFDLTTTFTDAESAVISCDYCVSTDGICDTEWLAGVVSGAGPAYTCAKTGITGLNGAALTLNMRGTSSGGTTAATAVARTVDTAAPTDGTLAATGGSAAVTLNWTAATDAGSGLNATGAYKLVFAQSATPPADCTLGTQIYLGNLLTYNHTPVTNGLPYSYRVCAYDNVGNVSAGPTATATPLPKTDGLVAFGNTLAVVGTPRYRRWTGSTASFDAANSSAVNNTTVGLNFMVNRDAPTRGEIMMGALHTNGFFYVQRFNGTTWTSDGAFTAAAVGTGTTRHFDIAYEQTSGDAMVAYERDVVADCVIAYRTWNGTAWSAPGALTLAAPCTTGTVTWVKLVPRPGTDQILLIARIAASGLYAHIWNGTAWDAGRKVNNTFALSANASEMFDGAWESVSGDAMVFFDKDTATRGMAYATYSTGAWSTNTDMPASFTLGGTRLAYMAAASDRNSDHIAVIGAVAGGNIDAEVWDGTAWSAFALTNGTLFPAVASGNPIDVAWERAGSPSRALFAWKNKTTLNKVRYMTYTVGAGWSVAGIDVAPDAGPGTGTLWTAASAVNMVELVPDNVLSASRQIMLTGVDSLLDIRSILWSNGVWTEPVNFYYEVSATTALYRSAGFCWKDFAPTGEVTGFVAANAATGNKLDLSWTNPLDMDFAGVKISRALGAVAPVDCSAPIATLTAPAAIYSDTGLVDASQYTYRICTYDTYNNTSAGVTGSGTPTDTTPPANVTNAVFLSGNGSSQILWTNPVDADFVGVKISRATGATPPADCAVVLATVLSPIATYTDTPLTNGLTYSYRLCAYDDGGPTVNNSSGVTGSVTPNPLGEVTGFTVISAGTGNQLNLSWTNPLHVNFVSVKIVRALGGTAPLDCSGVAVYSGTAQTYSDTPLTDGSLYSYRICTFNGAAYTAGVTGSGTPTDITPPANVTNLAASVGTLNTVVLNWTNPADADFVGVKISKATGATPPADCSAPLATLLSPIATYTDLAVVNGTQYAYRVCSYDDGVPAVNYSSGATVTAIPETDIVAPNAVIDLSVSVNYTRGVKLGWTAPGDDGTPLPVGTVASYDIRFTDAADYPANMTGVAVDATWGVIRQAINEPTPRVTPTLETFTASKDTLNGKFVPNTLYYLALKSADNAGNISVISNVAQSHTAMKYGYNLMSLPYNATTGALKTVSNIFGDDVGSIFMYRWQPSGLDALGYFSGTWQAVPAATLVTSLSNGGGYNLYAFGMNRYVLDEKDSLNAALVTENAANWVRVDLVRGRNLVGNPYLKNADFSNIKICKNATGFVDTTPLAGNPCTGTVAGTTFLTFAQAVTGLWMDSNIGYYGNSTTYSYETCNAIGCTAKLRPWWGQWVYLLLGTPDTYIMAVPKP